MEADLLEDGREVRPLVVVDGQERPPHMGRLQYPEDAQAFLEPYPVVADRRGEDDVGQPLDPTSQGHRFLGPALLPGADHVDLLAGHHGAEPDQGPGRAEQERLEDEVVVAGEERDLLRKPLEEARRVDEPPGVERRLLDRHHAIDESHRLEDVVLVVDAGQGRLELEQDKRQTDLGDGRVVRDRDGGVQRRAEIGGDREDQERIGAGGLEVAGLADGGVGAGERIGVLRERVVAQPFEAGEVADDGLEELVEALARLGRSVTYTVLDVDGPPHDRTFTCAAVIDGEEAGVGKGPSKKAAEQEAAREALAKLESS